MHAQAQSIAIFRTQVETYKTSIKTEVLLSILEVVYKKKEVKSTRYYDSNHGPRKHLILDDTFQYGSNP